MVQDVGKQGHVQLAALILEAHHAVVVLVELLGQLIVRQADAALQRGLAGVLHQNGSALGNLVNQLVPYCTSHRHPSLM